MGLLEEYTNFSYVMVVLPAICSAFQQYLATSAADDHKDVHDLLIVMRWITTSMILFIFVVYHCFFMIRLKQHWYRRHKWSKTGISTSAPEAKSTHTTNRSSLLFVGSAGHH